LIHVRYQANCRLKPEIASVPKSAKCCRETKPKNYRVNHGPEL
jgi:hypothetical protein